MRQCIVKMLSYIVVNCLFQTAIADVNDKQLSNYILKTMKKFQCYFLCAEVVLLLIQKLTSYILEFVLCFLFIYCEQWRKMLPVIRVALGMLCGASLQTSSGGLMGLRNAAVQRQ